MGFMDAVRTCLSKFVDINGRARRSEYWWFFLFNVLVQIVATVFDSALGMGGPQSVGLLAPLASLALLLPAITAGGSPNTNTRYKFWTDRRPSHHHNAPAVHLLGFCQSRSFPSAH